MLASYLWTRSHLIMSNVSFLSALTPKAENSFHGRRLFILHPTKKYYFKNLHALQGVLM
jgi:hypothetical protein